MLKVHQTLLNSVCILKSSEELPQIRWIRLDLSGPGWKCLVKCIKCLEEKIDFSSIVHLTSIQFPASQYLSLCSKVLHMIHML